MKAQRNVILFLERKGKKDGLGLVMNANILYFHCCHQLVYRNKVIFVSLRKLQKCCNVPYSVLVF